jgi:hypothetical protein
MRAGARTPGELETLLEDAFVIRDGEALAELFEDGAVFVAEEGVREARGGHEIAGLAREMWQRNRTYLADPRLVLPALEPLAVPSDEDEARWWFGTLAVIKTTAAETGGQLTIIDIINPPGLELSLLVSRARC